MFVPVGIDVCERFGEVKESGVVRSEGGTVVVVVVVGGDGGVVDDIPANDDARVQEHDSWGV